MKHAQTINQKVHLQDLYPALVHIHTANKQNSQKDLLIISEQVNFTKRYYQYHLQVGQNP